MSSKQIWKSSKLEVQSSKERSLHQSSIAGVGIIVPPGFFHIVSPCFVFFFISEGGYNRVNQREPTWGSHFFFGCSLASCFELLELMVVQTISFWCRSSDRGDFVWPKSLVKSWGRTLIFCTSMYTYCIWVTYRAFGGMLREQTATAKVLSQQDRHFPCDFCWTKRLSKCFVWDVRRKVFSSDSVATDCLNTAGVGMCMARSVRQIIDSQMAMAGNLYCS